MIILEVRYAPATGVRGSGFVVSDGSKSLRVPYDHSASDAAVAAAVEFAARYRLTGSIVEVAGRGPIRRFVLL